MIEGDSVSGLEDFWPLALHSSLFFGWWSSGVGLGKNSGSEIPVGWSVPASRLRMEHSKTLASGTVAAAGVECDSGFLIYGLTCESGKDSERADLIKYAGVECIDSFVAAGSLDDGNDMGRQNGSIVGGSSYREEIPPVLGQHVPMCKGIGPVVARKCLDVGSVV